MSKLKKLFKLQPKQITLLCSAKPNALPLQRSDIIQELCKTHDNASTDNSIGVLNGIPNAESWANQFISTAHLLESYMLLHHHKETKRLLYKFRFVDPDRPEKLTESNKLLSKENIQSQDMEELSFLTHFAFILKTAGYEEIPENIVKKCIEESHTYNRIELQVRSKNYDIMRFWVFGRKEVFLEDVDISSLWKDFYVDQNKGILHERVIVASRNKKSSNMILKGFKDIPLDHLEALLPEAKIIVPRYRKLLYHSTFTITGIFAFLNVGMFILTEFHINLAFVLMIFTGIVAYRISERHKMHENKHVLDLKRMLYYKSTANNSGLVLEIINKAAERSLKEALIVYGNALMLVEDGGTVTEQKVLESSYEWLSNVNKRQIDVDDVDFSSAFAFLQQLGIIKLDLHHNNPELSKFQVLSLENASIHLLIRLQNIAAN